MRREKECEPRYHSLPALPTEREEDWGTSRRKEKLRGNGFNEKEALYTQKKDFSNNKLQIRSILIAEKVFHPPRSSKPPTF